MLLKGSDSCEVGHAFVMASFWLGPLVLHFSVPIFLHDKTMLGYMEVPPNNPMIIVFTVDTNLSDVPPLGDELIQIYSGCFFAALFCLWTVVEVFRISKDLASYTGFLDTWMKASWLSFVASLTGKSKRRSERRGKGSLETATLLGTQDGFTQRISVGRVAKAVLFGCQPSSAAVCAEVRAAENSWSSNLGASQAL